MISALILAFAPGGGSTSPEAVVRSLAALVPAAIENLVRDVTLVGPDRPTSADFEAIADHAGCSLHLIATEREGLRLDLAEARCGLSLVLRAGFAPRQEFTAELADLARGVASGSKRGAVLRAEMRGVVRLTTFRAPIAALLGPRRILLSSTGADLEGLARRLRPNARFDCGVLRVG